MLFKKCPKISAFFFVCVHFNGVLKLPAWMNAKSQWLHCFLHYVFSKCPSDRMHIHIICICVAFPQCEFLKLSSCWVHEWMQNHNDYICFEYHNGCFFFKMSFRYDIYSHWLHLGGFSPKVRFKSVLKLVAWVDAKLQWLHLFGEHLVNPQLSLLVHHHLNGIHHPHGNLSYPITISITGTNSDTSPCS